MLLARMQCNGTMMQERPKYRGRQGLFLVNDRPGDFANARVDYLKYICFSGVFLPMVSRGLTAPGGLPPPEVSRRRRQPGSNGPL